jgi:cyanophycin synthetase
MAHGVPADSIEVIPDEQQATDRALQVAQAGDLVLIFADALTRTWKQVIHFRSDAPARPLERERATPVVAVERPHLEVPSLNGDSLVRDERGVRLARETDD